MQRDIGEGDDEGQRHHGDDATGQPVPDAGVLPDGARPPRVEAHPGGEGEHDERRVAQGDHHHAAEEPRGRARGGRGSAGCRDRAGGPAPSSAHCSIVAAGLRACPASSWQRVAAARVRRRYRMGDEGPGAAVASMSVRSPSVSVVVPGSHLMPALLGQRDSHLRRIEACVPRHGRARARQRDLPRRSERRGGRAPVRGARAAAAARRGRSTTRPWCARST